MPEPLTTKELNELLCEVYERDREQGADADNDDLIKRLQRHGLTKSAWEFLLLTLCTDRV